MSASGCAEFNQAGTAIGHGTREGAREIGHAICVATAAVGADTSRAWNKVTKGDSEKTR